MTMVTFLSADLSEIRSQRFGSVDNDNNIYMSLTLPPFSSSSPAAEMLSWCDGLIEMPADVSYKC